MGELRDGFAINHTSSKLRKYTMKNLSSLGAFVKDQAREFRIKGAKTFSDPRCSHYVTRHGVPLHDMIHDVTADRSLERWSDEVVGRLTERSTSACCIAAGYTTDRFGFEVSDIPQTYPFKIHTIALDMVAERYGKMAVMRTHIPTDVPGWTVRCILNRPDVITFYRECFADICMSLLALTDEEIAIEEKSIGKIIATRKEQKAAKKAAKSAE